MSRLANDNQPDEVCLMQRVAQRDPEALRALYDRCGRFVLSICIRILRDRHEAEQLLIDVFTEVWERSARFDATRGSPITYLVTLARSRAIDRIRARKNNSPVSLDVVAAVVATSDKSPGPVEQSLAGERRTIVRQAMNSLEPSQRQAVELAFYDGMSHSEIAQKLNKPLGTIKTHIRQGLIRLKGQLRNQWEGAKSFT